MFDAGSWCLNHFDGIDASRYDRCQCEQVHNNSYLRKSLFNVVVGNIWMHKTHRVPIVLPAYSQLGGHVAHAMALILIEDSKVTNMVRA